MKSKRYVSSSGVAMIEATMILPLIVAVMFSVIEFSSIISSYFTLTRVSYEAARISGTISQLATDSYGNVTDKRVYLPANHSTWSSSDLQNNRIWQLVSRSFPGAHLEDSLAVQAVAVKIPDGSGSTIDGISVSIQLQVPTLFHTSLSYIQGDTNGNMTLGQTSTGPILSIAQ